MIAAVMLTGPPVSLARARHDVRGDHDRVQRHGGPHAAARRPALPRAELQPAGRQRFPRGNRAAGGDRPGAAELHRVVARPDAVHAARAVPDLHVGRRCTAYSSPSRPCATAATSSAPTSRTAAAPAIRHRSSPRPGTALLLVAHIVPIVLLSKQIAIPIDYGVRVLGAPEALVGFLVAALILVARVASRGARGARQPAAALDQPAARLGAREHQPDHPGGAGDRPADRAHGGARPGRRWTSILLVLTLCHQHAHLRQRPHQRAAWRGAPAALLRLPVLIFER